MKKISFTLLELIVVIAVIATLATVVTPQVFKAIERAKTAVVISEFKAIKKGVLTYYLDTNNWGGLVFTTDDPENSWQTSFFFKDNGSPGWDGPYLERPPGVAYSWGISYYYYNPDSQHFFNSNDATERFIGALIEDFNAATRIDKLLDDGNLKTGFVRYIKHGLNLLVYIISHDGPLD